MNCKSGFSPIKSARWPWSLGDSTLAMHLHDAHAKNFSLLYSGKTPVLAPFYDTLSTAVYPSPTPKMAMKIGSKYKFSEVQARHWEQFAEGLGFTKAQTKRRILALAELLPATARKLQSSPGQGFAGNIVVEKN